MTSSSYSGILINKIFHQEYEEKIKENTEVNKKDEIIIENDIKQREIENFSQKILVEVRMELTL